MTSNFQEEFTDVASVVTRNTAAPGSGIKQRMNERDLLRLCIENPKYLGKALGHDRDQGTGLTSVE